MEYQEEQKTEHEQPEEEKKQINRYLIGFLIALVAFIALGGIGVTVSESYHKDRIFHGISIGHLDVGGLEKQQAMDILTTWHDQWWANELQYRVLDENGKEITAIELLPIFVAGQGGESIDLIRYDLNAMLNHAYAYGRSPSIFARIKNQILLLVNNESLHPVVEVDEEKLTELLQIELEEYETEAIDASFELTSETGQPVLISESQGNTFDYQSAVRATVDLVNEMDSASVEISRRIQDPQIYTEDVKSALTQLDAVKELFPANVTYLDPKIDFHRDWTVSLNEVLPLLSVVSDETGSTMIGLSESKEDATRAFFLSLSKL